MKDEKTPALAQALDLALNLSPLDKVRLVEQLMATLEQELAEPAKKPRPSLYGLWADLQISGEDLDEMRQQVWNSFPREDLG